MGCATTIEEKSRNARGCNTENNLALTMEIMAEGVVEVCLACAFWTMEKEHLARESGDCLDDLVKGPALVWIQSVNVLCSQLSLLLKIIRPLLCNKRISNNGTPILLRMRHVRPVAERHVAGQQLVNKIEAIVKVILLNGIDMDIVGMESVMEVITKIGFVLISEIGRTGGITFLEDGDK